MKTQIIFLEDYTTLSNHSGTFENPVALNHPPMLVSHDNKTPTQYSGDYTVKVPKNERIQIWLQDPNHRTDVIIAPVRFLANTWNGESLSLNTVTGSDSPIGRPNYSVSHEDEYGFAYTGAQTEWEATSQSPFTQYFHGVDAKRDGNGEAPRIHHPYVTFNFTDYAGTLYYGIEFTVLVKGQSQGYWWFDPTIQVMD